MAIKVSDSDGAMHFSAVFDSDQAERDFEAFLAKIKNKSQSFEGIDFNSSSIRQARDSQIAFMDSIAKARLELVKQKQAESDLNLEYLQGKIDLQKFTTEQAKLNAQRKEQARIERELKRQLAQNSEYGKLTTALGNLRKESKNVLAELISLENQGKRNSQSFKDLTARANDLVRQTIILDKQVKSIDVAVGQNFKNVGNYGDAISMVLPQLSQFTGRLGLLGLAAAAVHQSFKANLELEPLQQGLKSVTTSGQSVNETLKFLRETSDRLGLQFTSTAESFKMWQGAAKYSNLTANESRRIFESVANAGAKMKLSNDQVQGTFLALSQMMSKGKVQAEELRGQLAERLPGAFQLAAQAMGVTEQQLNKMLEKGEVISQDFLPKFADQLEKSFGSDKTEKVEGMQASINRLSNEFDRLWQSDKAQKFFTVVIDGLANITSSIGKLVKSENWQEFFLRLGGQLTGGLNGKIMDIGGDAINATEAFKKMTKAEQEEYEYRIRISEFSKKDIKEQLRLLDEQKKALDYFVTVYNSTGKRKDKDNLILNSERLSDMTRYLSQDGAFDKKSNKKEVDQKALDKAKREAEKLAEQQRQALERQRSLQLEIDKINENATRRNLSRDQQEIASIKEKYAKIREEARKFHDDPKNKGKRVDISGLSSSEKQEINDAVYKQQTSKILKVYQEDYVNFIKYEDLKKQYGEKLANEQLGQYKSTFEKISGEYAGLQAKQSMVGLTGLEKERMRELEKLIITHSKKVNDDKLAEYLDALNAAKTANQKMLEVENDYQKKLKAIRDNANGKDTTEQEGRLKKDRDRSISQIATEELTGSIEWEQIFSGMDDMAVGQIDKLLSIIEKDFDKLKGKFDPVDLKRIKKQLEDARAELITKNPFGELGKAFKNMFSDAASDSDGATKDMKKNFHVLAQAMGASFEVLDGAINSVDILKDALGGVGDVALASLSAIVTISMAVSAAIKAAERGSVVLAIVQAALVVVQAIAGLFKSIFAANDKRLEKSIQSKKAAVEELDRAFEKLGRSIDKSVGNAYYSDSQKQIENLKEQSKLIEQMMADEDAKKKTDQGKLQDYRNQLEANKNKIEDIQQAMVDMMLQTTFKDFASDLGDALVEAFERGEDKIKAMDKTFNDFIKNSIINSLKMSILQGPIDAMMKAASDYASKNNFSLDGFGFDYWKGIIGKAGDDFYNSLDSIYKGMGLERGSESGSSGLKGAVQRELTEATASELTGLFRASLELQKKDSSTLINQLNIATSSLSALNSIQVNTAETVKRLDSAVKELQTMNKNLGGRY